MTISIVLIFLLGLVLLVASMLVKPIMISVLFLAGGTVITIWLTYIFSSIPLMYEQDHRNVENEYHRQIIGELDRMLTEGRTNEAQRLIQDYLTKVEDSSFMRNSLHELIQSFNSETAEPQR